MLNMHLGGKPQISPRGRTFPTLRTCTSSKNLEFHLADACSPPKSTSTEQKPREQTNENRNQSLFAKRRRRRNPRSHRVNRGCGADEVVGDDPSLAPLAPAGLRSVFEGRKGDFLIFWLADACSNHSEPPPRRKNLKICLTDAHSPRRNRFADQKTSFFTQDAQKSRVPSLRGQAR